MINTIRNNDFRELLLEFNFIITYFLEILNPIKIILKG